MAKKKPVSRELAQAVGYYIMNPGNSVKDVAHDWKVGEAELQDLIDRVHDDGGFWLAAEEAIADWIEDNQEEI